MKQRIYVNNEAKVMLTVKQRTVAVDRGRGAIDVNKGTKDNTPSNN